MQLKYHDDIKWQDLPKIERPFFAQATIQHELSKPWTRLQKGIFRDPLSEIVLRGRREIDPYALKRLLRKVEEGSVLLVHTFEGDTPYPAFIWKKDDKHPDKGYWTLSEQLYSASEYHFNLLLSTVKRPQQRGSIKVSTVPSTEYGYIPSSTQNPSVGESIVTDVAKTIAQFLYKVGSKAVILATLKPSTAGGTTTYEIPNEPDIRIIESDLEPARYQRRVDGEWQTTGIPANRVVVDNRSMGFEALSPEDAKSLKTTGGIPIAPQAKPTIEGYPPDSPPDTSKTMFPDKQDEMDSSTSSFPAEGPSAMASPGFNQGTDVEDVVGPSVMYNEAKENFPTNTNPTGQWGGKPTGRRTTNKLDASPEYKRSIRRENESADILANSGYKVEQNPTVPGPKNPDYVIEGKVFDNYEPKTDNPRNILDTVSSKVTVEQADRIVVNMSDTTVKRHQLRQGLEENPIDGLKEIILIEQNSNIIKFFP